jgi:hypothetical protein
VARSEGAFDDAMRAEAEAAAGMAPLPVRA